MGSLWSADNRGKVKAPCVATLGHGARAAQGWDNGWEPVDWERDIAFYTSGDEDKYFGWEDDRHLARRVRAMLLDAGAGEVTVLGGYGASESRFHLWYECTEGSGYHSAAPDMVACRVVRLRPENTT